ncbi:MAG: sigma-54-dependent Fis family transcriptional regulator [Deltaproteobacteria bacterium]|nr:sigma-54-dependent Fis family transcriptional regulator [Deltaproteobacteria bacterium]
MSDPIRPVVLVVDDELAIQESLRTILEEEYEVIPCATGADALKAVQDYPVEIVLLDIKLPGMDGLEVLQRIKGIDEGIEVIVVTAVQTTRMAINALKGGAFDYITKPFDVDEIKAVVRRGLEKQRLAKELIYLRSELERPEDMVGRNPQMLQIYDLITSVAPTEATVLITGESGTGKELVARALHRRSPRHDAPFVTVNCASVPETLAESELFGHERGAFTGALFKHLGKFELAHGGTLFLDEIGSMRLDLQAKLLRAIQQREIERVGGRKTIKVDVRLIAATNLDLRRAIAQKGFREDLYYRLNVVPIHLPPLRERRDDIPLLVTHFLEKYNRRFRKELRGISKGALSFLVNYRWPGNIRELENLIERLVALSRGDNITLHDLPLNIFASDEDFVQGHLGGEMTLKRARQEFERQYILRILEQAGWNQSEAARVLGVHRNTLVLKLQTLGLRERLPTGVPEKALPGPAQEI